MPDAATARARADTCALLARLCLTEIDGPTLALLRRAPPFASTLAGPDVPLLAALRAEYAWLFLLNAVPYESVYVDEALRLNTAATEAVAAAYRAGGFRPAGAVGAPDHVGLELAFLGHLAAAEADALTRGDAAAAAAQRAAQRRFLAEHLGRWAPVWATACQRLARHPFYATLAEVVRDYVLGELEAALAAPA
jgi:TorA maturation chaperone TorD